MRNVLAFLVASLACLARADAATRTIRGRVVDEAGRGVADADVAPAWTLGTAGAKPLQGVRTDADGRFSIACSYAGEALPLFAYDAARARGAFAEVEPAAVGAEQILALGPLVEVQGELSAGLGLHPGICACWMGPGPRHPGALRIEPDKGKFSVRVPPGAYAFAAQAPGRRPHSATLSLAPGAAPHAMGKIDLVEREERVLPGEPGPPIALHVSDRALDELLAGQHLPRRWTLLYFWDST